MYISSYADFNDFFGFAKKSNVMLCLGRKPESVFAFPCDVANDEINRERHQKHT
jgi:hypothetical protein